MIRLHLRLPTPEDWPRYYDSNISGGGIFCPSSEPPDVGLEVKVEITFVAGPRFFLKGIVMWRRPPLKDPRARAGVGIKVHAIDRGKLEYVNAWSRGGVLDKRDVRRLPVRLRATYTGRSGRRINFTRDLSETGVFVRSQELLDLNTPIKLMLAPPGTDFKPFALEGVVARLVDTDDERGMGILLNFAGDKDRTRYTSFVQKLEERYLAGDLPDDVVS